MVGEHMSAYQILPPTIEICNDETQLQPMDGGASLFECSIEEPPQLTYSTPQASSVQPQQAHGKYKAEKKRLKLERLRLKNLNLEFQNLKLKKINRTVRQAIDAIRRKIKEKKITRVYLSSNYIFIM